MQHALTIQQIPKGPKMAPLSSFWTCSGSAPPSAQAAHPLLGLKQQLLGFEDRNGNLMRMVVADDYRGSHRRFAQARLRAASLLLTLSVGFAQTAQSRA